MSHFNKIQAEIEVKLQKKGLACSFISINHFDKIKEDIQKFYTGNAFDPGFYEERIAKFTFDLSNIKFDVKSIIVSLSPDLLYKIPYEWNGTEGELVIPPTYLFWEKVNDYAGKLISEVLNSHGYKIAPAYLPLKLLSVRGDLTKYGRNNISYGENTGSYHRLTGFYTDLECPEDNWHELQTIDLCTKCDACMRNCPTHAIESARFLLHAERCLTYLNEKPPEVQFPDWVKPIWHNALVGCMICQKVCPANKSKLRTNDVDVKFTSDDVSLLLQFHELEKLPDHLRNKLERCDLAYMIEVVSRNLKAILEKESN